MTPEQILELADDCGPNVYKYQSLPGYSSIEFGNESLVKFVKLIEAATREECAKRVDVLDKAFNTGGVFAAEIRSGT